MELTFSRTAMKKAVDTCVSIAPDKKQSLIWLLTVGKDNIFLYTSRDEKGLKYFHHMYSTQPIQGNVSIIVKCSDLLDLLKTKEKEVTFDIDQVSDNPSVSFNDQTITANFFNGKFPIQKVPYKEMDTDEFYKTIGTAAQAIGKGKNDQFIGFGGRQIVIRSKIYQKRINLDEDIQPYTFPSEYLTMLYKKMIWRKSDSKKLDVSDLDNSLYVRLTSASKNKSESFRQLFVLQDANRQLPSVKNFETETVHSFDVNAPELLKTIDQYPASIKDVYLYDKDGQLCIDPYDKRDGDYEEDETQPVYKLAYQGAVKRTKISVEALKSLLIGYEGDVAIDIEAFEMNDETYHMFQIYHKMMYSSALVKKEPNYEKVQKKLDAIIEKQKQIKYL